MTWIVLLLLKIGAPWKVIKGNANIHGKSSPVKKRAFTNDMDSIFTPRRNWCSLESIKGSAKKLVLLFQFVIWMSTHFTNRQ